MKKVLCCVYDSTANVYSNPFTSISHQVAMRDFSHACADQNTDLCKSPECFSLHAIGEFDDSTGVITTCIPSPIAYATQFVQEK